MKDDLKQFIKQVIALSLPVMAQQLLNNLLNMADTVMIGTISENAISAVAVANKVFFIYQLILFGFTNGVGIFISQYSASKRQGKISDIFNFGVRISLLLSFIAIFICLFFQRDILNLYLENETVIGFSGQYLTILTLSFIPFALTNMYSVAFRTLGYPSYPMMAGALSFVINVVLNAVLIFGLFGFPRLEIAGAAIATVTARLVEAMTLMLLSQRKLKDTAWKWKIDLDWTFKTRVLSKAFPLMTNELIWSLGLNIIFINYSYAAESFIPAITVVDTISNLVYLAFSGCSVAISVIIGRELGSGDLSRIKLYVKRLMALAMAIYITGGLILIATNQITPTLFSLSSDNKHMASQMLIIKALLSWTQGYANTIYYVLRAGGDTKSVLIIDGIFTWVGPVLISFVAARLFHLSLWWIYLLVEGAGLLKVVLATYFLKKGAWIKNLTLETN